MTTATDKLRDWFQRSRFDDDCETLEDYRLKLAARLDVLGAPVSDGATDEEIVAAIENLGTELSNE